MYPKSIYTLIISAITLTGVWCAGQSVRIVDFGADLGWGELFYRGESVTKGTNSTVDRDKNGTTDNDFVSSWHFSLEKPLNMPGLRYDTDAKNAVFYGGLVLYSCNPAKPKAPRAISEGHLNSNHEFRDDLNFMGGLAEHGKNELVEAYANWFWKKQDFLNGGDKNAVSFDATSRIVVHVSRYWGGFNAGRWMVREGERFYLSQTTWGNTTKAYSFVRENNKEVESASKNPIVHTSHILRPTETAWAEYHPQKQLDFDSKQAVFKKIDFKDVTAVGFFVERELAPAQKVASALRPPLAFKWNAFRCDAVVKRPSDHYVKMVPVTSAGNGTTPALYMSEGEVRFKEWQAMLRIGVTNQYCFGLGDLGYAFTRDGAMGSMESDTDSHSSHEPVTGISWHDAIAFCNLLSEVEGMEPVYYTDAEFKTILRRVKDRDMRENWDKRPAVFWNRKANGYRLPTETEWKMAAGDDFNTSASKPKSTGRTHAVGSASPNKHGIHDMNGNVWEYVWVESKTVGQPPSEIVVLGGDFRNSPDPLKTSSYPDRTDSPWHGSPSIGFRIVRNAKQTLLSEPVGADNIPKWSFAENTRIRATTTDKATLAKKIREKLKWVVLPAGLANEMEEIPAEVIQQSNKTIAKAQNERFLGNISEEEADVIIKQNTLKTTRPSTPYPLAFGATEIPYDLWKLVKHWAEDHGYAFNYHGDIGSIRHATSDGFPHEQNEPVTFISWYDMIVWCNALSEILGYTPVFYQDKEWKEVYRHALEFRLDTYPDHVPPNLPWEKQVLKGERTHTGSGDKIFFSSKANGARPPLDIEFKHINKQPQVGATDAIEWTHTNSKNTTHPVGRLQADANGLYDMNGNVFEWGWDTQSTYYERQNSDYKVNGNGYFYEAYEKTQPRSAKKQHAYSDYTSNAKPFIGFRVVAHPEK